MSVEPSPNAIRSKLWRDRKKQAIPADVRALLERRIAERIEMGRQSKALLALSQIEATAARKLIHIQNVKQPAIRARLLGELADWIIDRRETLKEAAAVKMFRVERVKSRRVPAWVPADLVHAYLDPTVTEFEAAKICRAMKREAGGGE